MTHGNCLLIYCPYRETSNGSLRVLGTSYPCACSCTCIYIYVSELFPFHFPICNIYNGCIEVEFVSLIRFSRRRYSEWHQVPTSTHGKSKRMGKISAINQLHLTYVSD